MVLPLSFLLLVFFTYDLDQPRAATSSFRSGTRSDASCTVQEFPIQRQEPELRCQKQLSVFIKKDLRVMAQNVRRYSRGIISEDAAGVTGWTREAARAGASAQNLAVSASDYST